MSSVLYMFDGLNVSGKRNAPTSASAKSHINKTCLERSEAVHDDMTSVTPHDELAQGRWHVQGEIQCSRNQFYQL